MATHDEPAPFKARVNLVMVPVVVRDRQGKAVGTLKQEDFQLFDKGKPQFIARFSMERAAMYTTSGQTIQDFTDDRTLLHDALSKLRMRPVTGQGTRNCPTMTYYMADMIQNKHDPTVLDAAARDVMTCQSLDPSQYAMAQRQAEQAAQQELNLGDHETRLAMGVIKELVRRMAAMPGQRSIILVSSGFVTLAEHSIEKTDIMDRAIRSSVLINSLDARGLYTDTPDITRQGTNYITEMVLHQMERETNRAQSDVMAELAAGTGATFFQNNNDLDAGFARLATAPEYYS